MGTIENEDDDDTKNGMSKHTTTCSPKNKIHLQIVDEESNKQQAAPVNTLWECANGCINNAVVVVAAVAATAAAATVVVVQKEVTKRKQSSRRRKNK